MILDERITFTDGGDFSGEAGTANVGDQIPLGVTGQNIAVNPVMYLVINVETAADGGAGNAGTIQFQLASDASATISTDGSQTIHFTSKAYTASELTEGTTLVFPLPLQDYEAYLGLQKVQAVEGEDDMVASAYLTVCPPVRKYYPDADN